MPHHRRNRRWLGGALLIALVTVGAPSAQGVGSPTITNLVSNPSVGTNTAGWVAHNVGVSDSVADRSTAWAQSGAYSMHYAGISGTTTLGGTGITGVIGTFVLPASGAWGYPVSAGQAYTSSAWVNVVSAGRPRSRGRSRRCAEASGASRRTQCRTAGGTASSSSRRDSSCLRGRKNAGTRVSTMSAQATQ